MKEIYIDREDLHHVIYPAVLNGELAGQHDMEGNILFVANPERYPVVKEPTPEPTTVRHPLQGEFILQNPWTNEYNPAPYRGATPRGRRT